MTKNVLVIEDNEDIAEVVSLHLKDLPCAVKHAADGIIGYQLAQTNKYDLVILDLMLPGMEGLEICKRLRAQPNYTPILMLTSKSSEIDRVLGLEMGADDYLTKPFSVRELLARVKALFRRMDVFSDAKQNKKTTIERASIRIDLEKRTVFITEKMIDLTVKEFDLLVQFIENPGRVYTRTQLLDLVWGYGHAGYEHTVNSHINRLRNKIENNPAKPQYILTVWGLGYKFNDAL